jgi:Winged helix DNA-binding domain
MAPEAVVRHLLGVQAQVLPASGLALAARTEGLTRESVDRARERDRSIVLTWAMRGTLHLLAAEDCAWLPPLALEPRISHSRRRLEQLGLKSDQVDRAVRAIERMLGRNGPLTRQEILERLRRHGFRTANEAIVYHLLLLAASSIGVCHGPGRGAERRFILSHDWIGRSKRMDRHSALAEIALRYLAAHGPATPSDLAFWSGLPMADVRRGWRGIADRLVEVEAVGTTLWAVRSRPEEPAAGVVRLLPNFDEYLLGWRNRAFFVGPDQWKTVNRGGGWLHPVLLVDGRAEGTWKAEGRRGTWRVNVRPFGRLSPRVRREVGANAEHLAAFLSTSAEVSFQ